MKLITEPSIYVMQSPTCTWGHDFLLDHDIEWESDAADGGAKLAEFAGRLCYMSFSKPRPGGNAAYLEHIKEAGHGSVLEHATWSFIFTGVSRSLTHELIRHRAGFGYSQLSQRYVDESDVTFVVPMDLLSEMKAYQPLLDGVVGINVTPEMMVFANWRATVREANETYRELVEYMTGKAEAAGLTKTDARKYARQAARSVLPNATETKIFVSANARAIRHFLEQRGSRFAEPEIRRLANRLLDIMQVESSALFGDYERVPLPDGTFEIVTKYRKV